MSNAAASLTRTYPRRETIQGRGLDFRLMSSEDKDLVLKFARSLPEADLVYLRYDITDPARIDDWCANIDAGKTSTVLVLENGSVVGYGSVHHHQLDWSRHIGEFRIMVNTELRGLGVGRYIGSELLHICQDLGLKRAVVHIASDQPRVRHMFESMGFHAEALLTDWVIDRNGRMCDLIIMSQMID